MAVEIKDIGTHLVYSDGRIYSKRLKRFLKLSITSRGYVCVSYNGKDVKLHRMIASVFIPNPENKPFINHRNAIKTDNRVENLEWCTPKENSQHASRMGLIKHSETYLEDRRQKGFNVIQAMGNIS